MKTITLQDVSESLHRKLQTRAQHHHCTVEQEALRCLEELIQADEVALKEVSDQSWPVIEQSLVAALNDATSEVSEADLRRYRDLAKGHGAA
jgi:hypothetical protein